MATNNTPANTLRCGNIKATIWQNVRWITGTFYFSGSAYPLALISSRGVV